MLTGFYYNNSIIFYLFTKTKNQGKHNLYRLLLFMSIAFFATWLYTSNQTGGLINKRYANQDAAGRVKESQLSGREKIWDGEIDDFLDNPVFGVGVAKALEIREEQTGGKIIASHSEISRTFAEHGTMGIIALFNRVYATFFISG